MLIVPFRPISFVLFFVLIGKLRLLFGVIFLCFLDDYDDDLHECAAGARKAKEPTRVPKTLHEYAKHNVEHYAENLDEYGKFEPSCFALGCKRNRRVRAEKQHNHCKEGHPRTFKMQHGFEHEFKQ